MDTVTHALLPVIVTAVVLRDKKPDWLLGRSGFVIIGIAGALPDLLSPHLSIDSRLNSWSHGLPFWFLLSTVLLLLCAVVRQRWNIGRLRLAFVLRWHFRRHQFALSLPQSDLGRLLGAARLLDPLGHPLRFDLLLDLSTAPALAKARQTKSRRPP